MEYTTENTYLQIVRMKDDNENGGLGAALKRSLAPSQFYVIEKKPEIVSSFYYSLIEPSAVFTVTKNARDFLLELIIPQAESLGEEPDLHNLCKKIKVLKNQSMWIDDSEIQSVTELCEKCRRVKEEHHIQFVVIDDFLHLPIPESVQRGLDAPDAAYRQLCQLAKELNIVVVALLEPSVNHHDEDHPSHRKNKHTQGKGLNAILNKPD